MDLVHLLSRPHLDLPYIERVVRDGPDDAKGSTQEAVSGLGDWDTKLRPANGEMHAMYYTFDRIVERTLAGVVGNAKMFVPPEESADHTARQDEYRLVNFPGGAGGTSSSRPRPTAAGDGLVRP